jgi:hypothetical protein
MFDNRDEVEAFIGEFEAERLPISRWTHEAHLVTGYWYVWLYGAVGTMGQLRTRIRRHNESVGTRNTEDSGYHETITRLYVDGIARHIAENAGQPFEVGLKRLLASPLRSRDWPLTYYTSHRLFSVEARREWVEPDRTNGERTVALRPARPQRHPLLKFRRNADEGGRRASSGTADAVLQ